MARGEAEATTLVLGGTGKTGRRVADRLRRALGRKPRDFAAYARAAAATGVWHRAGQPAAAVR